MGRKMIIYRNEEYMTLGGESRSFPAEAAEKNFHDRVKERVMELLNVSADEAEAMMEDGCEEGVYYNQADGYASIRFGSDVWEHLAVVDIPDDDEWKDLGHCRFVSADQRMEIRACHNKSGYFWRLRDRLTGRTKDLSVLDICKAGGQLWAKESREKRMYNSVLSARLLFNNDEEVVRRAKVYLAAKNVGRFHGILGIDTSFETVTEMMSSLFPGVYGVDLTGLSTTTGYCKQYLGDISVTCDWFWTAQGLYDAIKPALLEGSSLQLLSDQA